MHSVLRTVSLHDVWDSGSCGEMIVQGYEGRCAVARKPFTECVKHMIEEMAGRFRWKRKNAARRNAIHLLSAAVGVLVLAPAVDDRRLSDELLESVRDSLASL